MYKTFFGLNDNPFSIVPNPHYLFLSVRHKEALAHLTYGMGETGGFALLTGEVGTGKTTISRCLLNNMPENTDTPVILNPSLSDMELLATICDQLLIPYSKNPTLKQFTDLITQHLLKSHAAGRNTVLIIDEAQHLKPEVLEQLRLLTNLETDTKKLLKIILIGQPELQQLLKKRELRQLAQRITARYHLLPLDESEVGLYVRHRLQVAGCIKPIFTAAAIKRLHRATEGIPRIINLICDKALLLAYAQSKMTIDHKMVDIAKNEVQGEPQKVGSNLWPYIALAGFILSFCAVLFLLQYHSDKHSSTPNPKTINSAKLSKTKSLKETVSQQQLDLAMSKNTNIDTAFDILLGLWDRTPYQNMTPCQSGKTQGLECLQQQGNLTSIIRLNYPAVVYLQTNNGQYAYGTLISNKANELLLQLSEQQFWVSKSWFKQHFTGIFEIFWQPSKKVTATISSRSSASQLQWLENALAKIDAVPARKIEHYDQQLENRVKTFQQQHGLLADGIAGTQTLARLNLYLNHHGPKLSGSISVE